VGALLVGSVASAQLAPPGAHWGMCLYPVAHAEERALFQVHRFTQFDGDGDPHPSGIAETAGINLASLAFTRELVGDLDHRFTYTFELGAGWTGEKPSEWLQNNYLHKLRDLRTVPVGATRSETEFTAGGALNYWLGTDEPHRHRSPAEHDDVRWQGFVGAGLGTSTLFHESFAHTGGSLFLPWCNVRLSALDRVSWPYGGDAYPDVAPFTNIVQFGVSYVPDNYYLGPSGSLLEVWNEFWKLENLWPHRWLSTLHTLIARPEVGVYLTWDSGLFVKPDGDEIDTAFVSFRFDWATGLRLETWNDMLSGTDYGASYGVAISFDLGTMIRGMQ
jgi:hypothetical protein